MGTAIRAIIAGLGGGAESLGSSMQQSDAEKKALQRLIMVEQMKEAGKSVWGNAFPGEDEQGPGLFQENKQTGEVRRVETQRQPEAGVPAPSRAIRALTQSSGAENDPTSGGGQAPPAPPVAPDTNPPVAPRARGGVRPYQKPTTQPPHTVATDKGIMQWNPDTKKYEPTGMQPPAADHFTTVTVGGADENSPGQVKLLNTKTGQVGPSIGDAKHTIKVESAMNTAAKARLEAAVSEMNNSHTNMTEYERKLASGEASINGLAQFLGATANSFTHDDPASRLIQSQSLAILNRTNPDLARYIRRGLSFAEGESMISQRPSDFRTKMAAFLSTASSGAKPEMIADIQGRRTAILTPLNRVVTPSTDVHTTPTKKPAKKGGKDYGIFGPSGDD